MVTSNQVLPFLPHSPAPELRPELQLHSWAVLLHTDPLLALFCLTHCNSVNLKIPYKKQGQSILPFSPDATASLPLESPNPELASLQTDTLYPAKRNSLMQELLVEDFCPVNQIRGTQQPSLISEYVFDG